MSEPFLGEIRTFGSNFAPRGWSFCAGQQLSIAQNTALFSLLGTTYGGNGQTTFALPDLRGRFPNNQGQGPGLSSYTIGQVSGTESTSLTVSNLPAHSHSDLASPTKGSLQGPTAGAFLGKGIDSAGAAVPQIYVPAGSQGTTVPLAAGTPVGNNIPVGIMNPYLTLNMCIALEGIFPSRN